MAYFLIYTFKASFCLLLFYLFYRLFLSRETFFRFNRWVVLSMILLAFLLPLCRFTVDQPIPLQQQTIDWELILFAATSGIEQEEIGWNPYSIFFSIYLAGMAIVFAQYLAAAFRVGKIIRGARLHEVDDCSVFLVEADINPFSWMNKIVISEKDWAENGTEIFAHEKAHSLAGHSYDLLVVNICLLFQWFNPALWLLKQELQNLHEYEADDAVLKQGIDAKKYQLLLIKKAVGEQRFVSVTNSFNQAKLKNRIAMMLTRKSNPWRRLKFLGILPLAAFAVVAFARPEMSADLEIPTVEAVTDSVKISPIPANTIYIVDGKKVESSAVQKLASSDIWSIDVHKEPSPELLEGLNLKKGNYGVILVTTRKNAKNLGKEQQSFYKNLKVPLVIVDGEVFNGDLNQLEPSKIHEISVIKEREALNEYIQKYGSRAQNGVMLVQLKK